MGPQTMQGKIPKLVQQLALTGGVLLASFWVFAASPDWGAYQKSGDRSPKWDALVQGGFEAFDTGNWSTASNFLERARGIGCKDGLLLLKLGIYQEYLKEYNKAIQLLKSAEQPLRTAYPDNPSTKAWPEHMGRIYYETGQYDIALPYLVAAIDQLGENFNRLFLVGQILRMQKQWQPAITAFEKSLKYDSSAKILVLLELMKAYHQMGQQEAALKYADAVLAADPANPTALSFRQQIEKQHRDQREKEEIQKMIE